MQSQATIAEIDKDAEGSFVPRVLKQKIWVEGISYELQEIYGMEHASSNKGSEVAFRRPSSPLLSVVSCPPHPALSCSPF